MSHAKQASKRKQRSKVIKAAPVLGAAGLSLLLAGGALATTGGAAADMPARNTAPDHEITLGEEEISDVSLATFYVFDKENLETPIPGMQLARGGGGCGHGGCGGRGCGGRGGFGGCGGGRGCGFGGCGGYGGYGGYGYGCYGGYGYGGGCCLSWGGCRYC